MDKLEDNRKESDSVNDSAMLALISYRVLYKIIGFCVLIAFELLNFSLMITIRGKMHLLPARAAWFSRFCRHLLWLLGVETTIKGAPPSGGLLVCNHLSYLDIITLAAQRPLIFVSKREVRGWPLFGWLARLAGTIFIDRQDRTDVLRVGKEIEIAINKGVTVCLFPEGTSSDGSEVLPFRSSLFEPAVTSNWPVTPAAIDYRILVGSVADDVCYWGDMIFVYHFFRLLRKRRIYAHIHYGCSRQSVISRKELAVFLRARVKELRERFF